MEPTFERGYSGPWACKLTGASYRRLDYWDRIGLVSPSLAGAHGSGTQRRYSERDVACLRAVVRLRALGIRTDICAEVVRAVRDGDTGILALDGEAFTVDLAELAAAPEDRKPTLEAVG